MKTMALSDHAMKKIKAMGLDCEVEALPSLLTLRLRVKSPSTGKSAVISSISFSSNLPETEGNVDWIVNEIEQAARLGMAEPAARGLNG